MPGHLKQLYWDLSSRYGRFEYLNAILKHIPGGLGMTLRSAIIPKYFGKAGKDVQVCEGVRFRVAEKLFVGNNVRIGIDCFIQAGGGIFIDDDVMIGPGVKIWSQNHRYGDLNKAIPDQGYDYESVHIGKGVWLGAGVFVLPGVNIPEGCVISAGSLVSKKVYKPYTVLAGYPCKPIGTRKPSTTQAISEREGV